MTSPARGRRDPGQRAAHGRDLAEARVQQAEQRDDRDRRPEQAEQRHHGAGCAANARPEHDREIDDIRPRQHLTQRIGVVEFLGRHPALDLDQHAARPGQHTAEARKRDDRECDEEFGQAGRGSLRGSGRVGDGLGHGRVTLTRRASGTNGNYRNGPMSGTKVRRLWSFFINDHRLYCGCRATGYGDKRPS